MKFKPPMTLVEQLDHERAGHPLDLRTRPAICERSFRVTFTKAGIALNEAARLGGGEGSRSFPLAAAFDTNTTELAVSALPKAPNMGR
jgi:hypothetical protein